MAECFGPIAEKAGKDWNREASQKAFCVLTEALSGLQDWAEFAKAMKKDRICVIETGGH